MQSTLGSRDLRAGRATTRRRIAWMLVVVAALLVAFAPFPTGVSQPAPIHRLIHVQAGQYAYAPSGIHVNRGDTVTIELASTDSVHGLYIDGYGYSVQADPGQVASLTFIANRPGSFRFRCNVTCGALHPFMIGKLAVGRDTTMLRSAGLTVLGVLGVLLIRREAATAGLAS